MEENQKNRQELFYKELIQEAGLEQPSIHFTASVISKIQKEKQSARIFSYRPLIPSYVWWVSAILLGAFFGYTILDPKNLEFNGLPDANFGIFDYEVLINVLNNFSIPDTLIYATSCLAIFITFQAYFLKIQWDNRFA